MPCEIIIGDCEFVSYKHEKYNCICPVCKIPHKTTLTNLKCSHRNCLKWRKPGLIKQTYNLTKALIKYAVNGSPRVDKKTYEQRILICHSCPLYSEGSCLHCGCCIDIPNIPISKAKMKTEHCPLKKWENG